MLHYGICTWISLTIDEIICFAGPVVFLARNGFLFLLLINITFIEVEYRAVRKPRNKKSELSEMKISSDTMYMGGKTFFG